MKKSFLIGILLPLTLAIITISMGKLELLFFLCIGIGIFSFLPTIFKPFLSEKVSAWGTAPYGKFTTIPEQKQVKQETIESNLPQQFLLLGLPSFLVAIVMLIVFK